MKDEDIDFNKYYELDCNMPMIVPLKLIHY